MIDADHFVAQFPNRDAMASEYARLMRAHGVTWQWWPELNRAIIARWSTAALVYVKTRAWKEVAA